MVLDVDDTLFLERDYVKSGFRAVDEYVHSHYGTTQFFERAWAAFNRGHRGTTFDEVVSSDELLRQLGSNLVPELVEVYRNHKPCIELLPDARDFLTAYMGTVDFAVVTDGPSVSQRAKVCSLGLKRWVPEIVITAEHGSDWAKPSTFAFGYLQDLFGSASESCVYFADNPRKDFIGPRALGWRTYRVRRPGGLHASVDGGGADSEVETFSEIAL